VARQSRQQKQQKDAQAKDASPKDASPKDATGKQNPATDASAKDALPVKAPHVITNDEIPSHVGTTVTTARGSQADDEPDARGNSGDRDARAEQLKSRIEAQKSAIAGLEGEIASLNESIHYAGGNCVANCVQWNERQKQKQDQVESMRAQLEEQKKQLENMQDSARKQGFGSAVYDP
jgi:predicted RNase H-like nuclease (RuvC/YqgF family)